ncbi:hypothetical protein NMY22_g5106 [Coprinellus aureogranulatus]|nr:hypothetical protein NMY22_g5106 [Coprinellus aureogranulatus]
MATHPIPSDVSQLVQLDDLPIPRGQRERDQRRLEIWTRWQSMLPFFASHGLHLYEYSPGTGKEAVPPSQPKSSHSHAMPWPWARNAYNREEDLEFSFLTTARVWPARDANGHEVIIRLASSGPSASEELNVFWRLNTPEARGDPRNHTLPVLGYLNFNDLVFVVMPRWETVAHSPWAPACSVLELLELAEVFYEGLEFLHEKRIAHRDIYTSNTVMDVLVPLGEDVYNLRTPGAVRYAYIDYNVSITFPLDTDIDALQTDRLMRGPIRDRGLKPGLCNPFKDDVICLTGMAQTMVRVIDNVVPEIGSFFDSILRCKYEEVPSAREALRSFRELRAKVTEHQLKQPPGGVYWKGYTRKG